MEQVCPPNPCIVFSTMNKYVTSERYPGPFSSGLQRKMFPSPHVNGWLKAADHYPTPPQPAALLTAVLLPGLSHLHVCLSTAWLCLCHFPSKCLQHHSRVTQVPSAKTSPSYQPRFPTVSCKLPSQSLAPAVPSMTVQTHGPALGGHEVCASSVTSLVPLSHSFLFQLLLAACILPKCT